jgi:transaldolase
VTAASEARPAGDDAALIKARIAAEPALILDDRDLMQALIADIRQIYDNYGFGTQILAASIRTVNHVSEAAKIGADVATVPPAVIKKLAEHPLTDKGIDAFLADWEKTGQKIL